MNQQTIIVRHVSYRAVGDMLAKEHARIKAELEAGAPVVETVSFNNLEWVKRLHYLADVRHELADLSMRPLHSRVGKNGKPLVWRERDLATPSEQWLAFHNRHLNQPHTPCEVTVFDMDGTLADVSELVKTWLEDGKKDFDQFHQQAEYAPPHDWVVEAAQNCGTPVVIVTARNTRYAPQTVRWLQKHGVPHIKLYMRGDDDFRPDYEVKKDLVNDIQQDGYTIVYAWDDNPAVVELWQELGVPHTVVPSHHHQ